jgi:hypothetical protein
VDDGARVRADVHERLEAAAAEMLAVESIYVALVSEFFVEKMNGEWSPPVQHRITPSERHPGIVDLEFRKVEA